MSRQLHSSPSPSPPLWRPGSPPAEENLNRVLDFTHAGTEQDLQSIATLIRSMTGVRNADLGAARKTLAVSGTARQIALV